MNNGEKSDNRSVQLNPYDSSNPKKHHGADMASNKDELAHDGMVDMEKLCYLNDMGQAQSGKSVGIQNLKSKDIITSQLDKPRDLDEESRYFGRILSA